MMKSSLMKMVCSINWLVTALVCVNIGLIPFGYDFFAMPMFVEKVGAHMIYVHYFIGLCGAFSLATFVMMSMGGCGDCKCSGG